MIYQPGLSIVNQLVRRASKITRLSEKEIRGPSRYRIVAHVRFAVMHLARERGLSSPQIARALGNRDHTTILSGVKRAVALRNDPDFARLIDALEAEEVCPDVTDDEVVG